MLLLIHTQVSGLTYRVQVEYLAIVTSSMLSMSIVLNIHDEVMQLKARENESGLKCCH